MKRYIKRSVALLIISMLIITMFPLRAYAQRETISQATSIDENTEYSGSILFGIGNSFYKIVVRDPGSYCFKLSTDFYARITIYNEQEKRLGMSYSSLSNPYLEYSMDLSAGVYYIEIEIMGVVSGQGYYHYKFSYGPTSNNQPIEDDAAYKYFADVPEGSTGETEINSAYEQGIVGGFGKNTAGKQIYKPTKPVTRAQFAIMLYNLANNMGFVEDENKIENCSFTDIKKGDTGYKEVAWANANGIITGFSSKSFKPKNNITRAQITLMLIKYGNYIGEDTSNRVENAASYRDYIWVQDNFKDSVKWAMAEGILSGFKKGGYPVINPDGSATRAQCAMFVWRYYSKPHFLLKNVEEDYKEYNERIDELKSEGIFVADGQVDMTINSEDEVLSVLDDSGIRKDINFKEEYVVVDSEDFGDGTFYTLNQVYNDIEVMGSELYIATDNNGYVNSIYGSYISDGLPESINVLPEDMVFQMALGKAKEIYNTDNVNVESNGLKLFKYDDMYRPVYIFRCSNNSLNCFGSITLFIDAVTREILYEADDTVNAMEIQTAEGQDCEYALEVEHSDGKYYLLDTNKKLRVINCAGDENWLKTVNDKEKYSDIYYETPFWNEDKSEIYKVTPSGVDLLANVKLASTFYSRLFDRSIMRKYKQDSDDNGYLYLCVNAQNDGINSYCHGDGAISVTPLASGYNKTFSAYLDCMGHEYTHGVIYNETSTRKQDYSDESHEYKAINEGLADVFGNLIEDYTGDRLLNGTGDGVIFKDIIGETRRLSDFMVASKYCNDKDMDEHKGTPIITYPVYLMNKGINDDSEKMISNTQIAYMYYDLIHKLSRQDSFVSYRAKLEDLMYNKGEFGDNYQLTDSQKDCVIDALDSVGIEGPYVYKLLTTGQINIAGADHKAYFDTNIEIKDLSGKVCASEDINLGCVNLNKFDLSSGVYNIIVTDNANGRTYNFSCILNDNNAHSKYVKKYKESITVFVDNITSFKEDYDWKPISLNDLSLYLDGGANKQVVSDFLPFVPGYDNSDIKGLRSEMSDTQARKTISDGLGFHADSIYINRKKFKTNGVEWDYYMYRISDTNNAIKFFTGLDISTNRLTTGAEGVEFKYDGTYIYAPVWYAGPPSVDLVKAEKSATDIRLYYYWGGPGPTDDPWVAYFGLMPNGKYRLYSTKHLWE